MLASIGTVARGLMVFASFAGLCAALRVHLKLHRFVAPFAAACCVIVLLMFAGMVGVLKPAAIALYALGALGLIDVCCVRRERLEWGLILALLAALAFMYWRYGPCHFWRTDDFSHWGHAARHLLRTDRFPNGGDSYIYFQSYPLGSACFIYYLARFVSAEEGFILFAQSALYVLLYLPVFSLVRQQRRIYYPILAALFFLLYSHCFFKILLAVDLLLAFFGIGIAAAIHAPHRSQSAMVAAALPGIVAVALIKNSGLFFSILSAVLLFLAARRGGMSRGRRWALMLSTIALPVAAYLIWTLHISLRFPAAFSSKHAVSLSAYVAQLHSKGLRVVGRIALAQVKALLHLKDTLAVSVPFLLIVSLFILITVHRLPRGARRRVYKAFLFDIGAYALWFVMVFLMYVFSMPEKEALGLASFSRYNGTGLVYATGLCAMLLLEMLQYRKPLLPYALLRAVACAAALGLAAVLILAAWPGQVPVFGELFERDVEYTDLRKLLNEAQRQSGLAPLDRCILYCRGDKDIYERRFPHAYYCIKYTFDSGDIRVIADEKSTPGQYIAGTRWKAQNIDRASDFLAENIDGSMAVILLDESPEFESELEAFLEARAIDIPVYRIFSSFPELGT